MADGWTAYIKNVIDSAPNAIKKAVIVGLADGSVWAKSEPPNGQTFNANADEIKQICSLLEGERYQEAPMTGIHLEGVKYLVPFAQEGLIFGKRPNSGCFIAKTNTAALIALYQGEATECQSCRSAVERVASYLQSQGY